VVFVIVIALSFSAIRHSCDVFIIIIDLIWPHMMNYTFLNDRSANWNIGYNDYNIRFTMITDYDWLVLFMKWGVFHLLLKR
jgi:hypothetical protein